MTENWHPDLQKLAAEYSPGMVLRAFAVKEGIEEDGYPGLKFMETTDTYLKGDAPKIIKLKVEKHMRTELAKLPYN